MKKNNTIQSRMNFNEEPEKIILLEDNGSFDISIIKEKPHHHPNEINAFLSLIKVQYEFLSKFEEKICLINDLKINFDFIKILYNNENEQREINYFIKKNMHYSTKEILHKINDKPIFGNKIKKALKIKDFPLQNYILEEIDINNYLTYYDKIYILKNSKNEINDNLSGDEQMIEKVKSLENKLIAIENNINQKLNNRILEINKKVNYLSDYANYLEFKKVEKCYKQKISDFNNNSQIKEIILKKTFKRSFYIYCPYKNIYLYMTNQGKIEQNFMKNKWDIEINFANKTMIFYSNNFYLAENNRNIIGDKNNNEKWSFRIKDGSYYFICQKNIDNSILSAEDEEIKVNKSIPGNYEKFILIDHAFEDNNERILMNSNLSQKINDIEDSISLMANSSDNCG